VGILCSVAETINDRYVISPLAGTTVNVSSSPFTTRAYPLEPGLIINMRGGDDTVNLMALSDMRNLNVDLGDGFDTLNAKMVETRGAMSFFGGLGDDIFQLQAVESHASFSVNLGAGNDQLLASNIDGTAGSILGGAGNETVQLDDADFTHFLFRGDSGNGRLIYTGLQSETEATALINLGDGDEVV
jgi:hypothetical protein